ncbi:ornithine cyclodeaminase [Pararobbsia silviterrae]|nr:ornithine cyclodeaminase [Pararobbsia silviterrae]
MNPTFKAPGVKRFLVFSCAPLFVAACSPHSDQNAAPASDAAAASAPAADFASAPAAAAQAVTSGPSVAAAASDAQASATAEASDAGAAPITENHAALAPAASDVGASAAAAAPAFELRPHLPGHDLQADIVSPALPAPPPAAHGPGPLAGGAAPPALATSDARAADTQPASSATIPSGFASVDKAISDMISGNLVFNVPTPIDVDDSCPCRIDAILSPNVGVATLRAQIAASNPDATDFQSASIKMSDRMTARLSADPDDFTVDPKGDQEQAVGLQSPAKWSWLVTPNNWGRHTLHLVIFANVDIQGQSAPVGVVTFDKPLEVTVTPVGRIKRFITAHGEWAWGALVVPFAVWLWKQRRVLGL